MKQIRHLSNSPMRIRNRASKLPTIWKMVNIILLLRRL
jgi:hypothetical protein